MLLLLLPKWWRRRRRILPLAPPRPPSTVKPEMSVSSNYTALLRLLLRSVSVPVCFAKHLLNKAMQPTCVIYDSVLISIQQFWPQVNPVVNPYIYFVTLHPLGGWIDGQLLPCMLMGGWPHFHVIIHWLTHLHFLIQNEITATVPKTNTAIQKYTPTWIGVDERRDHPLIK